MKPFFISSGDEHEAPAPDADANFSLAAPLPSKFSPKQMTSSSSSSSFLLFRPTVNSPPTTQGFLLRVLRAIDWYIFKQKKRNKETLFLFLYSQRRRDDGKT
ncbi:hypothetical protein V8G54_021609 [Vigna mungo]|uniref:Uncharacterized protein n=1 Tax=Vigna mungo TaxID=3915 RepID=A0AAQ3NGF0_VIGMU